MKVYIGPYLNYFGPYQFAKLICFWELFMAKDEYGCRFDDHSSKLGAWLNDMWIGKFLNWIWSKRERKIKIKIHEYDAWNADDTLSMIILPVLKEVAKDKHGCPIIEDEDVPEGIRSSNDPDFTQEKFDNYGTTDKHFKSRWDYVLGEMIWAFEQLNREDDPEAEFYEKNDLDGAKAYRDRIQNGLLLFGKYYRTLWT